MIEPMQYIQVTNTLGYQVTIAALDIDSNLRLCAPKPSKTPKVVSWGFGTPESLDAHAQIASNKNHRLG